MTMDALQQIIKHCEELQSDHFYLEAINELLAIEDEVSVDKRRFFLLFTICG